MTMTHSAPRGNCNNIDWRVLHPNVDTMRGPKPLTAPFMVYVDAIIKAISHTLTSVTASLTCDILNFVHRTPVCPWRSLSTAVNLSCGVRNHAETGELGITKQKHPKRRVSAPASR